MTAGALAGLLALLAALGLIGLLAFVLLRASRGLPGGGGGAGAPVRFLRSVPVGRAERVTLVSYRGEVFMLGVASGGVTLLARMEEEPLPEAGEGPPASPWLAERFKAAMSAARRQDAEPKPDAKTAASAERASADGAASPPSRPDDPPNARRDGGVDAVPSG